MEAKSYSRGNAKDSGWRLCPPHGLGTDRDHLTWSVENKPEDPPAAQKSVSIKLARSGMVRCYSWLVTVHLQVSLRGILCGFCVLGTNRFLFIASLVYGLKWKIEAIITRVSLTGKIMRCTEGKRIGNKWEGSGARKSRKFTVHHLQIHLTVKSFSREHGRQTIPPGPPVFPAYGKCASSSAAVKEPWRRHLSKETGVWLGCYEPAFCLSKNLVYS